MKLVSGALAICVLASALGGGARPAAAADDDGLLPTGFRITPTAAPGSTFVRLATGLRADGNADAAEASAVALSPDGATLLVLTSGYNLKFQTEAGVDITHPPIDPATGRPDPHAPALKKAEWVFAYDVSRGVPVPVQKIALPNTFVGLAWRRDGRAFFVSGGIDDRVYAFVRATTSPRAAFAPAYRSPGRASGIVATTASRVVSMTETVSSLPFTT